ncbi:MAG: TolC family protein [Gammaproteobacteria bacterium]|nr:TolC family protein [Gammaproteobacteria bacterium]
MLLRYLPTFLFLCSHTLALNSSALSIEISDMLDSSHQLKSSYYSYLQSVENQKLTQSSSNPSFYLTLSPYIYNWERDSTNEGSGGGVIGDLSKATKISHRLLRNVSHKLSALQDGTAAQYDSVSKYDYTYSEYDAGVSYTLIDFGKQQANNEMAKLDTNNSLNSFESQKQNQILNGLDIYTQIVTSRNIILYAKHIKKQIQEDIKVNFSNKNTNQKDQTDQEKAKSTLNNIDSLIVQEKIALSKAINQYESVFGHKPKDIPDYKLLSIPKNKLPKSKKNFINKVEKENLDIITAKNNVLNNKENYKQTTARHYPTISGSVDSSLSYNGSGEDMKDENYTVTLSANYSTTFFTQGHEDKIAKLSILRSQEDFLDTKTNKLKNADQAWVSFELDKKQLEYQIEGIRKSQIFIKKATKEYNDGNRSLLDILDAKIQILKEGIALFKSYNSYTFQAFQMLEMQNSLSSDDIRTENIEIKIIMDQIFLDDLKVRKIFTKKDEDPEKVIQQIDEFLQI